MHWICIELGVAGQAPVTRNITESREISAPGQGQETSPKPNTVSIYERFVASKATASNATNSTAKLRSLINA